MATLSDENQELADTVRSRIKGDPRKVILVIGTGVSYGMTKGHELCEWSGMVKALAKRLPESCPERVAFDKVPEETLKQSTTVTLGAGHMIREKLKELGKWDEAIDAISMTIWDAYSEESVWSRFFTAMGRRIAANPDLPLSMPLILTTNYDNLLEKALNALILTNPDLSKTSDDGPPPGFQLCSWDPEWCQQAFLKSIVDAPVLWKLHQRGRLEGRDAFVHHLHGSAFLPSTVVFDASDYERVILTQLWRDLANLFSPGNTATIFAGVGAGIFDRHFRLVWEQWKESYEVLGLVQEPSVFWLRAAGQDYDAAQKLLEENADAFPPGMIRLVSQEGHEWYPEWINQLFSDDCRYKF